MAELMTHTQATQSSPTSSSSEDIKGKAKPDKLVKPAAAGTTEKPTIRTEGAGPNQIAAAYARQGRIRSDWDELKEQSVLAFESGLLPRSIDSRQKAVTVALMGRELGLSPMQSLCGIYVVNGMTALRGSLMLRLIYERVPGSQITVLTPPEKADIECTVEMCRPHGKPHVFRFTLEDAKRAGFLNKPIWQQHPSTMLRWAAIRSGARVVFADAIAGCYMEDEIPAEEAATPKLESPEMRSAPSAPAVPFGGVGVAPVNQLPRRVTEKQVSRLFAIAHSKRWSRNEVGRWIEKEFQKKDPADLNRSEYDRVCNFLLENPRKSDSLRPAVN